VVLWFVEVSVTGVPHSLRSVAGTARQVPLAPAQSFQHPPLQDVWQQIPPTQKPLPQVPPEPPQHGWPLAPQAHVPAAQVRFALHAVPLVQQDCPWAPHARQVPAPPQIAPALQLEPPQHGWPTAPQARQEPPEHVVPPTVHAAPLVQQGWFVPPHALQEPPEHTVAVAVHAVAPAQQV
jgi:hypothetical protein